MKKFLKGFQHAFAGIAYALKTQINMRFHLVSALIVLVLSFFFQITQVEWLFILLSIALVFSAELFNTAIEGLTDLVTKEIHPLAKVAKDCAAGGVLVVSVFALVVGVLVFYKYVASVFNLV